MNHTIRVKLQIACVKTNYLPAKLYFTYWLSGIIPIIHNTLEITIRLVDIEEMHKLNLFYRNINKSTNVLAFPFKVPNMIKSSLIGDIIICRQIVEYEALEQTKMLEAHWAHIVIHGALHLLGYNHITDKHTKIMEQLEIDIMYKLGYSNPYIIE